MTVVETNRLRGTPVQSADLDDYATLHADGRVMATLGGVRSRERTRAYIETNAAHWEEHGFGTWCWRERGTGAFVGRGGLRWIEVGGERAVEVGYTVVAERWGQGLATEIARASVAHGFGALGLEELVGLTMTTNAASRRVLSKVGFRHERDLEWWGLPHVLCRLRAGDWRD